MNRLNALPAGPVVPVGGFSWPNNHYWPNKNAEVPSVVGYLDGRIVAYPTPSTLDLLESPSWLGMVAERVDAFFPETWILQDGSWTKAHQPKLAGPGYVGHAKAAPTSTREWVVKPVHHAGGVGIRLTDQTAFEKRLADSFKPYILQRRIRGRALGANFIAIRGPQGIDCHFLGAFGGLTHRRNQRHPFLYGGSYGPVALKPHVRGKIIALGSQIATQSGMVGLFNIDLIIGIDHSLALLEVNPRYSASMELVSFSPDSQADSLIALHTGCYRNESDNHSGSLNFSSPNRIGFHCKRIIYATNNTTIGELTIERIQQACNEVLDASNVRAAPCNMSVSVCDIPKPGTLVEAGQPAFTVIVRNSPDEKLALRCSFKIGRRLLLPRICQPKS